MDIVKLLKFCGLLIGFLIVFTGCEKASTVTGRTSIVSVDGARELPGGELRDAQGCSIGKLATLKADVAALRISVEEVCFAATGAQPQCVNVGAQMLNGLNFQSHLSEVLNARELPQGSFDSIQMSAAGSNATWVTGETTDLAIKGNAIQLNFAPALTTVGGLKLPVFCLSERVSVGEARSSVAIEDGNFHFSALSRSFAGVMGTPAD